MKVLIIGHGLAGASLSYQLYKKRISFTLVNNTNIASSRVAAGMVNPIVFRRLNKSWALEECLPVMDSFYRNLEQDLQQSFYHNIDIEKLLSKEESEFWNDKLLKDPSLSEYLNPPTQWIQSSGLKPFYGSGKVKKGGYVDLNLMLDSLQQKWNELQCFETCDFKHSDLKIEQNGYSWNNSTYTHVVFCEGVGVMQNPFFSWVALQPVKGELLTIYCENLPQDRVFNKNMFVLPIGNHHYKVGATYNWDDLSNQPSHEGLSQLTHKLEKIIDVPYKIVEHHAGVRPTVKDRRPIIGPHPQHKDMHIFNGLGTRGVLIAPYFSNILTQHLLSPKAEIPNTVNVKRYYQ